MHLQGGATSGDGLSAQAQVNGAGIRAIGVVGHGIAAGTSGGGGSARGIGAYSESGAGFYAEGYDAGIEAVAIGEGDGIRASGALTGSGIKSVGGDTGHGMHLQGGATSGNGLHSEAPGVGNGVYAQGGGVGAGIAANSGASGIGVEISGVVGGLLASCSGAGLDISGPSNDLGLAGATVTWAEIAEGTLTYGELMRILAGVAAGKTTIAPTGPGTADVTFRTITDTSDIVEASMTGSERTAVTVTP
jgi:hypothetical protein